MVELQPSKLVVRVRFPSPAPRQHELKILREKVDTLARAPVAQGIEQGTSNPQVAGSNPARRAQEFFGTSYAMLKAAAITWVNSPGSLGSTFRAEMRSSLSKSIVRRTVISTTLLGPATLI